MKKVLFIIIVLFSLGSSPGFAQCCGTSQKMIQQITASPLKMYYLKNAGSPFYVNQWQDASLTVTSGEIYPDLKVRLDLVKDELVYYNPAIKKQLVIDKESIKEFKLKDIPSGREILIRNVPKIDSAGKSIKQFYFILVTDSISLWARHIKEEVRNNDVSSLRGIQGYYYEKVKYFAVIHNYLYNVPTQKRRLAKMFPEYKHSIITYIRKQHINLKDDYQMSLLFGKINELVRSGTDSVNINPD